VISPSQKPLPTQHTTDIRDEHPCIQHYSNPRLQQSDGLRSTPYTARSPGLANSRSNISKLKHHIKVQCLRRVASVPGSSATRLHVCTRWHKPSEQHIFQPSRRHMPVVHTQKTRTTDTHTKQKSQLAYIKTPVFIKTGRSSLFSRKPIIGCYPEIAATSQYL
jgi:hypothetical protein